MNVANILEIVNTKIIEILYQVDVAEAEQEQAEGCKYCGGKLHRANYERRPRGLGAVLRIFKRRESFCCSVCRRRNTPKSVRFLGRKVYWGVLIIVAGILRGQGEKVSRICGGIGMAATTRRRWEVWWEVPVKKSQWWRAARERIMPALVGVNFIRELYERFLVASVEVEKALKNLLKFISPITIPAEYPS